MPAASHPWQAWAPAVGAMVLEGAMRHWFRLATLPLATLALLACVTPALAQDPARVQEEIARTDLRIERAATLLARSPNPEAQSYLNNARLIQARAQTAFSAGQYAIALRLTLDARGWADRAI